MKFLRRDVDAATCRYDDANSLVNNVDALEHVDGVIIISNRDAENVDGVDKTIDDTVT